MKTRLMLLALAATLLTVPLAARRSTVRVHFGIDPDHPYYKDYRHPERMKSLRNAVLPVLFEPVDKEKRVKRLQKAVGFVDFVDRGEADNELRIEIADPTVIPGDAPRDVFFRLTLKYVYVDKEGNKIESKTDATYWDFRSAARFSDLMTDVQKFAADIKVALINRLNDPAEVNKLVSRHLVELTVAEGKEAALCQNKKGVFVLRQRPEELGIAIGTVFRVKTLNVERDGAEVNGTYDARYHGTSGSADLPRDYHKKPRLIALEKADIEALATVKKVVTTSLHIREYKPGPKQNTGSGTTAFGN